MLDKNQQQSLALCGVFECCYLVDQIAREGQCDQQAQFAMLETLFVTDPKKIEDVYAQPQFLRDGQKQLISAVRGDNIQASAQVLRYALALMHLQQKLSKRSDMLSRLGQKIEQNQNQVSHFGIDHENVIAGLASTYQDTISTFNMRIQVGGHARFLQIEHNAARIRALLLAGIRSATLWRQLGGHRWNFLFSKTRIRKSAESLNQWLDMAD